jgi:hypothetical protein
VYTLANRWTGTPWIGHPDRDLQRNVEYDRYEGAGDASSHDKLRCLEKHSEAGSIGNINNHPAMICRSTIAGRRIVVAFYRDG